MLLGSCWSFGHFFKVAKKSPLSPRLVWGLSQGLVIQVQHDRSIRSNIPLMSSWSRRSVQRGEHQPTLASCAIHTDRTTTLLSANVVFVKKNMLHFQNLWSSLYTLGFDAALSSLTCIDLYWQKVRPEAMLTEGVHWNIQQIHWLTQTDIQ